MGSVGSGVAGEQEFAMKSVGTRTTLPRGPPLSRRGPSDRSFSTERLHAPPSASEVSSSITTDRAQLNSTSSHLERLPTNGNGPEGNGTGRRDAHRSGGVVLLDACGNVLGHNVEKIQDAPVKGRDITKRDSRMPPKILTVSEKLEQV